MRRRWSSGLVVAAALLAAPAVSRAQDAASAADAAPAANAAPATDAASAADAASGPDAVSSPDATSPGADLAAIRELALRANYRAALPAARAFLERSDLAPALRNEGLEVLATIHLAMRDEPAARSVLSELYARDPGHRLRDPDASPVVQSAFARARESATQVPVVIDHEPPVIERRAAPEITAQVSEHGDAVQEIRLAYRTRGSARTTTLVLPLDATGAATGRIPLATDDSAYTVEYWLDALAPSGHVLARQGSPDAPLTIEVPAPPAPQVAVAAPLVPDDRGEPNGDVTGEWWFWTLVGVAVVGAGVGVGVGVALGSDGPTDGSLGNVTLPLVAF